MAGGAPAGYMFGVTPGYTPGWDQPTYNPSASGTTWVGASSAQWATPASSSSGGPPPSSSFRRHSSASARDAQLAQQMGELTVQVTGLEETLNTHVESTSAWQRQAGERIAAMQQDQQRYIEAQRAYHVS